MKHMEILDILSIAISADALILVFTNGVHVGCHVLCQMSEGGWAGMVFVDSRKIQERLKSPWKLAVKHGFVSLTRKQW